MPRQDVPYGGAICRLKERIAEIWDRLDEKLHSINGVEGDGAGNVEIVSGDAAITVSESPTGHFIEIGLDHGNLPSAAVSSVNGQTGAVRLDAADVPSDGNSNVQADIAANKVAINALSRDIASEQVARQNADATLQTNINAVSASIPEMSTTPDPYKGVERDAQGRAFAADPAAGATDKTLVTANWVSQTGNDGPNNLVHKNGNEKVSGMKEGLWFGVLFDTLPAAASPNKWLRYMAFNTRYDISITEIIGTRANNGFCYSRAITSGTGQYLRVFPIDNTPGLSGLKVALAINKSTEKMEIWIFTSSAIQNANGLRFYNRSYNTLNNQNAEYFNTEYDELPTEGYTAFAYILGSA